MNKPEFAVALGANGQNDQRAFRIEMWEGQLVCLWEADGEADMAVLRQTADGAGRCHLVVYLDQVRRRATVFSTNGSLLADVNISDPKSKPGSEIHLLSRRGGLRLEQLIVRKCGGELPHQVAGSRSHLCRADGSIVFGDVEGYDAAKNQFVIAEKGGEKGRTTRIDAAGVDSIVWSRPNDAPSRDVHACMHDGVRVAGRLRRVKGGRLWLDCPGIAEPLGVKLSDLQGLSILNRSQAVATDGQLQGRLEMSGVRLHGCAVDAAELSKPHCLAWRRYGCETASPLESNASGRIVYREVLRPTPTPSGYRRGERVGAQPPRARVAPLLDVLAGGTSGVPSHRPLPSAPRGSASLYLCSGDAVPCNVKRIDQSGVWFESSKYAATFVPHESIKAIDLENASRDVKVNPTKRDRLLTLPRTRRDDPPKHLIRSVDGDYLRANVVSMDEETLTVEVRLEERHLQRSNVAKIIWLHAGGAAPKTAVAAQRPAQMRVQALCRDGNRVTVLFEKLAGTTLLGTSDTLGQCRINLNDVDQLLFGAIEQTAKDLPYQRWRLHPAQDPKYVRDEAAEETESTLAAKMAPDFTLEKLDGTPFRLSDQRGKVVVLDFWATWCGACIQVLPKIDRLVNQHKDQGVLLVAVNLQETPQTIQAALDRLKVKPTVVLDQNGAIAAKYAAVAIPQTVIIDRSGRVSHVFVGGGPQYVEQVQEALQKVLSEGDRRAASQ